MQMSCTLVFRGGYTLFRYPSFVNVVNAPLIGFTETCNIQDVQLRAPWRQTRPQPNGGTSRRQRLIDLWTLGLFVPAENSDCASTLWRGHRR